MYTSLVRYHFARFGVKFTGNESYYKDLVEIYNNIFPGLTMEQATYSALGYKNESEFLLRKSVIVDGDAINNLKEKFKVRYKSDVIDILNDDDLVPIYILGKRTSKEMRELLELNLAMRNVISNLPVVDTTIKLRKAHLAKAVRSLAPMFKLVEVDDTPRVTTRYIFTSLKNATDKLLGDILTVGNLSHEINTLVGLDFNFMSVREFKSLIDLSIVFDCTIEELYNLHLLTIGDFDSVYRSLGMMVGYSCGEYSSTRVNDKHVYRTTLESLQSNNGGLQNVYFD